MKKLSKIYTSREVATKLQKMKQAELHILSFFPCDQGNCECQTSIRKWKEDLAALPEHTRQDKIEKTRIVHCPKDKTGMKLYKITCNNCGQQLGFVYATDEKLSQWCDFHYTQWTDGEMWYGCLTPNISPISQKLTLECCCGADTRDFRANMTLPGIVAYRKEEQNKIGRDYGEPDSKFKVTLATKVDINKLSNYDYK